MPGFITVGFLPDELYIEVTNRCNSLCQTCVRTFEQPEPLGDMALDQFCALVDQVPELRRMVLHGIGEPMLNHGLPAMIAYLKRRARPPHLLFNSNAILLTPESGAALIGAGLDEFRVSIDAAGPARYARIRGVDAFHQVAANVGAFARQIREAHRGPQLSLWFTAMRENLADLPELIRLAHRLGVGEVYVQRLVYYGRGLARREQSLFCALQAEEEALLGQAEALASELTIGLHASGATTPRQSLFSGDRPAPWTVCRRPWSLMYVTANGNVLPCCFSPFSTRDYPRLILGNAFEMPLDQIWNGMLYRRFRAAHQSNTPPEACDRCGICWSL